MQVRIIVVEWVIVDDRHTAMSVYIMVRPSYLNAMKNKIYHNVRTVQKFNRNIVETDKRIPLTYMYINTHSPGLVHEVQ